MGRSWIQARTGEAEVKVMCQCWLCMGSSAGSLCLPAPAPWSLALQASARRRVLGRKTGQRGREVIAPWSLLWKIEEACLVCPSSCLWLALSILPSSPTHSEARWDPRRAGAAARFQAFLGRGEKDRWCCLTPVLPKPQLTVQSSVEGWEPVTEGQRVGSGKTSR